MTLSDGILSQGNMITCNLVCQLHRRHLSVSDTGLDRSSMSKDHGLFNSEVHTHLAHGVVGYLGLTNPTQLEPYGIHSAADLVDFVSRVRSSLWPLNSVASC